MKPGIFILALSATVVLGVTAANAATYSYSGTWTTSINNDLTGGGGVLSQNSSTTISSVANVPILNTTTLGLGEYVAGIQIEYSAPLGITSPTVIATTGVDSGSSDFTSLSASISTHITSPDVAAAFSANSPYDLLFSNPYNAISSQTGAPPSMTVDVGNPWIVSLSRSYDVFRLNALGNGALASALTSASPSSVNFKVDTVLTSQFTRGAAGGSVAANFLGTDSGTITITYTTIPEPGAALIGGLGLLALLRRRRR